MRKQAIVRTGTRHMDEGKEVTVEIMEDGKYINVYPYLDCGAGLSQSIYKECELEFIN